MSPELTEVGSEAGAAGSSERAPTPEVDARARPSSRLWRRAALTVGGPLLVSAAVVAALVTLFHTTYLTNDDAAIAAIAKGDYTGTRSSSLVVAPAMLGHVVRLGYALLPHLPWFGITLYTLQIVAWAAIGAAVFTLSRRPPIAERLVAAGVICAMAPWMILRVSYTPTSILLGVAGIVVFAVGARVPGRLGVAYTVAGGVLLGAVDLVRVSSFLAVVIVFAPVLLVIVVSAGVRRSAVFAVAVALLVLVGFGTSRLEYSRSAEWRAFMKMNSARGALHDTPRLYDENVSASDLQRIGWSRNDLQLFADFIYPDPAVYTDQDIRTLAKLSPPVHGNISVGHIFQVLRDSTDDRVVERGPVVSILVALGLLLTLRRSRTAVLVTLISIVWAVAVLAALLLYLRLPGRVLIPLEGGAAFLAVVVPAYLIPSSRPSKRKLGTSTAAVVLVAIFVAGPVWHGVRSTSRISRENRRNIAASQVVLDRLQALDPKGIFIGRGDLTGRWVEPLASSSAFTNPRIIPLGWATNSPLFTARLERVGINDVFEALQTNPHVYLLGFSSEATHLDRFYFQHRGVRVQFRIRERLLPVYFGAILGHFSVWSASVVPTP